ncbi:MAG: hypothetical protein ACKON7_07355 [Planctomycetaceae bacterium]
MRTIMLLALIVGGLVVAGAIHITQSGDQIEVSIDKQKVGAVTKRVVAEGETILRNAQSGGAPAATTR